MSTAFPESGVSGWLVFSSCYLVIPGLTRNLSVVYFVDVVSCRLVQENSLPIRQLIPENFLKSQSQTKNNLKNNY